ncbi:MAG: Zn-ribbon domain-containing protein [Halorientalis sp.]
MPHQCTTCGRTFADGSKEMLSGCPDCGGNKFQFHPSADEVPDEPDTSAEPPDPPGPDSSVARTVGNAATTVRNLVSGSGSGSPGPKPTPSEEGTSGTQSPDSFGMGEDVSTAEDTAQATARSKIVSPDEIPTGSTWESTTDNQSQSSNAPSVSPGGASGAAEADAPETGGDSDDGDDRPDLKQLREELNDQFESIKVLNPGQYELNLMELYDREEYIIALQEDGRYTIQVPETWHK